MIVGKLRKYTRHVAQNYGVTGPTNSTPRIG